MHVKKGMLEVHQPGLRRIRDRFCGGARLRNRRLVTREGVAVDQCMAGCATFDFSETDQIAAFEIAVSMFKLP